MDQLEELRRIKRDIEENGFNMNDWYRDMTEMDQDSCGKKLICELRSKEASGVSMSVRKYKNKQENLKTIVSILKYCSQFIHQKIYEILVESDQASQFTESVLFSLFRMRRN